jgi:uncharacterized damage-inducible protein DinB
VTAVIRSPLPDPPVDADEMATLTSFLDWYRDAMVRKVEGLDREQATRRLVPSATTLLGMIKHLAYVERGWFQGTFLGGHVERPRSDTDPDAEFRIEPGEEVAEIVDFYKVECERSRQIVAGASLEDHARRPDRTNFTLRWIMVHMIEETARHAGHADILREQIDGAIGE